MASPNTWALECQNTCCPEEGGRERGGRRERGGGREGGKEERRKGREGGKKGGREGKREGERRYQVETTIGLLHASESILIETIYVCDITSSCSRATALSIAVNGEIIAQAI